MKVHVNKDIDPLPFDGEENPTERVCPPLMERWVSECPQQVLKDQPRANEDGVMLTFRGGEKRTTPEGEIQYRRLRISVNLSAWVPWTPNETPPKGNRKIRRIPSKLRKLAKELKVPSKK